jgi:hypothetical protein
VYRQEPVDARDLDDERVLDHEVEPVAAFERCTLVLERHGPLALEPKPQDREFMSHAMLVCRLQQPRP